MKFCVCVCSFSSIKWFTPSDLASSLSLCVYVVGICEHISGQASRAQRTAWKRSLDSTGPSTFWTSTVITSIKCQSHHAHVRQCRDWFFKSESVQFSHSAKESSMSQGCRCLKEWWGRDGVWECEWNWKWHINNNKTQTTSTWALALAQATRKFTCAEVQCTQVWCGVYIMRTLTSVCLVLVLMFMKSGPRCWQYWAPPNASGSKFGPSPNRSPTGLVLHPRLAMDGHDVRMEEETRTSKTFFDVKCTRFLNKMHVVRVIFLQMQLWMAWALTHATATEGPTTVCSTTCAATLELCNWPHVLLMNFLTAEWSSWSYWKCCLFDTMISECIRHHRTFSESLACWSELNTGFLDSLLGQTLKSKKLLKIEEQKRQNTHNTEEITSAESIVVSYIRLFSCNHDNLRPYAFIYIPSTLFYLSEASRLGIIYLLDWGAQLDLVLISQGKPLQRIITSANRSFDVCVLSVQKDFPSALCSLHVSNCVVSSMTVGTG